MIPQAWLAPFIFRLTLSEGVPSSFPYIEPADLGVQC